jgi:hypothetical protein
MSFFPNRVAGLTAARRAVKPAGMGRTDRTAKLILLTWHHEKAFSVRIRRISPAKRRSPFRGHPPFRVLCLGGSLFPATTRKFSKRRVPSAARPPRTRELRALPRDPGDLNVASLWRGVTACPR